MKKKLGAISSILAAFIVAVMFWLVVKYIDSGALDAYLSAPSLWNVI